MRRVTPRAALVPMLCLALLGCTGDDGGGAKERASQTCQGAGSTIANSTGPAFEIEAVGRGGPFLHRYLRVERHRAEGHLCVDIVIDHADPGSEATAYTLTATQGDRTWEQSGTDPGDEDPMKVDARGCVDLTATLTVVGAGDEEFDYRAEGRAGVGCRE